MYKIIGGDQKEYGPVSFDQLAAWVRDNRANGQTLVQREGGPWVPLGSLPEFASMLPAGNVPPVGGAPAPEPVPGVGPSVTPGDYGARPVYPVGGGGGSLPPGGSGGGWGGASGGGEADRERARQAVSGPATALLVTGIICLLFSIFSLVANLIGTPFQPPPGDMPPELRQLFEAMKNFQGPVAVITGLISLAVSGLIIFGAQKLRALESYALVVTATVLAIVPCISPCCCIGLPVGIWALVVISKPEVKSVFR